MHCLNCSLVGSLNFFFVLHYKFPLSLPLFFSLSFSSSFPASIAILSRSPFTIVSATSLFFSLLLSSSLFSFAPLFHFHLLFFYLQSFLSLSLSPSFIYECNSTISIVVVFLLRTCSE